MLISHAVRGGGLVVCSSPATPAPFFNTAQLFLATDLAPLGVDMNRSSGIEFRRLYLILSCLGWRMGGSVTEERVCSCSKTPE